MSPVEAVLVALAGVAAGTINTVVGSGTLITFPTLLAFGVPPVTANVSNNIGLVPGSHCPHYDSEARRRPLYQRLVADGALPPGYAADDGVGLHYVDGVLHEAVRDRDGASAWRVDRDGETRVEARLLG